MGRPCILKSLFGTGVEGGTKGLVSLVSRMLLKVSCFGWFFKPGYKAVKEYVFLFGRLVLVQWKRGWER